MDGTRERRREVRLGRALLLGVGLAQLGLVALALVRVLDPGSITFGVVGTLAGLGMAGAGAGIGRARGSHRAALTGIGAAAVAAGLVSAGVWVSLGGGGISLNDVTRAAFLVGADVLFAASMCGAAVLLGSAHVPVLGGVAAVLALRAAIEVVILAGMAFPGPPMPPGTSSGAYGILIATVVLAGWLLLAIWEIGLGWYLHVFITRPSAS